MPNLVNDLIQYIGISLNTSESLNSLKKLNVRKRRRKKMRRRRLNENAAGLEANKDNWENPIKLWGQVKDCYGHAVENALVNLLKPVPQDGSIEYIRVAHTTTDRFGVYEFELSPDNENTRLIVIASKAGSGNERTIEENSDLCNP